MGCYGLKGAMYAKRVIRCGYLTGRSGGLMKQGRYGWDSRDDVQISLSRLWDEVRYRQGCMRLVQNEVPYMLKEIDTRQRGRARR